jgi:hypothetical protein
MVPVSFAEGQARAAAKTTPLDTNDGDSSNVVIITIAALAVVIAASLTVRRMRRA